MHVHLVFVSKYRRHVFDVDAIQRLREIFGKVCIDFEGKDSFAVQRYPSPTKPDGFAFRTLRVPQPWTGLPALLVIKKPAGW
jgi:hypothetical protein